MSTLILKLNLFDILSKARKQEKIKTEKFHLVIAKKKL